MKDSPLIKKSKAFALYVLSICKQLRATKCEPVLINQFIRSGTSICANIAESKYAHGRADFIAKLQIALKEASETGKWLKCYIKPRALQKNNTNILTDYVLQFGYY